MKFCAALFVLLFGIVSLTSAAPPAESLSDSAPQFGKWGFDSKGADFKTKPGDDFFRYANGAWLDRVKIPADKPGYSLRLLMSDKVEQRLHELIDEAAKKSEDAATIEGKVGAFYKSFMDEKRIEKAGASPLKDTLEQISSAKTREELGAMMGRHNADLEGMTFALGIDVDFKDPQRYAVYIGQSGLGLPDRDYYLKPDFAAQKTKY
jgi:putative endopeptidase